MSRELGYVHEPPTFGVGRAALRALVSAELASSFPDRGGFDREPFIFDQLGPSCTGHRGAMAVFGETREIVSPYSLYAWGRVHDGADPNEPLPVDVGVTMSGMLNAFSEHGACKWAMWSQITAGFDLSLLPPGLAGIDAQQRNIQEIPFFEDGEALVQANYAALSQLRSTSLVVEVDEAFDNPNNGVVGPYRGPSRGLHVITGWRYDVALGLFVANSWGESWGKDGCAWVHPSRIRESIFTSYTRGVS